MSGCSGRSPRKALTLQDSALELSPGGRWVHWGEVQSDGPSHYWRLMMNGNPGREYHGVSTENTFWTAECSKVLYTVVSSGRSFLVVDGVEVPLQSLIGGAPHPIKTPAVGNSMRGNPGTLLEASSIHCGAHPCEPLVLETLRVCGPIQG